MNKIYIEEKKSNDHNNMSDSNFQRNPDSEKVWGKFGSAKDLARLKSEEFKRILSKANQTTDTLKKAQEAKDKADAATSN